ncbi:MAG: serine hydrolase domain-containing protein [Candidatus Aminicenantales bacterium]
MIKRTVGALVLAIIAAGTAAAAVPGKRLPAARPEQVGMDSSRLALLDTLMSEALERKTFPGAVLCVVRKGKIVWKKAYGQSQWVPEARDMDADMMFDLASITKPVATATSVMILVERGQIRLWDKVKNFVPGFAPYLQEKGIPGEDARLWHLLTHTSGLPAYADVEEIEKKFGNPCPPERLVEYIAGLPKESPAGEAFVYSCLDYITLAHIVEKVSGQSIAEFAARNIFEPLGMTRTMFRPPAELVERCVPTRIIDGNPLRGTVDDPLARLQGGVSGNAGLFSTADDLAVFGEMLLGKGTSNGTRILGPLAVERMTEVFPRSPHSGRGLGWDLESEYATVRGDLFGSRSFGHSGYTGTSIWIDPETRTSVIFLTNRIHAGEADDIVSLRSRVANVVAASILDRSSDGSVRF